MLVLNVDLERLDSDVAPEFSRQLSDLVEGGERHFVLNLDRLTAIDSEGLDCILGLRRMVGRGGMVELTGVKGDVMKVFRLTRLSRSMTITEAA